MSDAIICQSCGIEAPCKYTEFYQNIGAFVLRFHSSVKGNLCKNCIHKHFWKTTAINATLGWWGVISFVVTPFFMLNNIIRYIAAAGLKPVPPGAAPPVVTTDVAHTLATHWQNIVDRVNAGEDLGSVCRDVASRTATTPGQVLCYAVAMSRQNAEPPPLPRV